MKISSPLTVLMLVIVLAALATWILPAGKYNKIYNKDGDSFIMTHVHGNVPLPFTQKTLDSLHILITIDKFIDGEIRKPVSVPGSYQLVTKNRQSFIQIIQAPLKGIYDSIEIFLFILVLGGFMKLFQDSGALVEGITALSQRMKGNEAWLIISFTFILSFAGSSYGMDAEALVFYPVMIPLFLAAGYDLLIPVAVIFGGTQLGQLSSVTNPFSTIIASDLAGLNWTDGLSERAAIFAVSTFLYIGYIVHYAQKVKRDPSASLVFRIDGKVSAPDQLILGKEAIKKISPKTTFLLLLFLTTFITMIAGVVTWGWWALEMSTVFLISSIVVGVVMRMNERIFVQKFMSGAETLLSVAFIVGIARGVTVILNEGNISDSILYYCVQATAHLPPAVFIMLLLIVFMGFNFFIPSTSGLAVLTMPIIGAIAIMIGVSGREVVNAYLFGTGIMGFITPAGLILPALAMVNISFKSWWRFIYPFLIILFIICTLYLIIDISLG